MFSTRAEARPAISSTSSTAWAITGSAPAQMVRLAVSFMTTKLVMWWTSGRFSSRNPRLSTMLSARDAKVISSSSSILPSGASSSSLSEGLSLGAEEIYYVRLRR